MNEQNESERVTIRLSPTTRSALNEIRDTLGLASDAEVVRRALGAFLRIAEAQNKNEKIFITDKDGRNVRELVFISK